MSRFNGTTRFRVSTRLDTAAASPKCQTPNANQLRTDARAGRSLALNLPSHPGECQSCQTNKRTGGSQVGDLALSVAWRVQSPHLQASSNGNCLLPRPRSAQFVQYNNTLRDCFAIGLEQSLQVIYCLVPEQCHETPRATVAVSLPLHGGGIQRPSAMDATRNGLARDGAQYGCAHTPRDSALWGPVAYLAPHLFLSDSITIVRASPEYKAMARTKPRQPRRTLQQRR